MHSVIGVYKKERLAYRLQNLQTCKPVFLYLIENTLWRGNIYKTISFLMNGFVIM